MNFLNFIFDYSLVAQWSRICLQWRRHSFDSWVRKIPWRWKHQPTLVFLPGEFHGQRSLAGFSPWGHKELDMTEWLKHTHVIILKFSLHDEYFNFNPYLDIFISYKILWWITWYICSMKASLCFFLPTFFLFVYWLYVFWYKTINGKMINIKHQ